MAQVKRNWDLLSNEKIGIIFAESLLDFFLKNLGLNLYNKGIQDSIDHLRDSFEDIKIDMETLLKK